MRIAFLMLGLVLASDAALAVCGERGGPAFRGPDGKCMGWANMSKCGTPPTTRCTFEGGGIGATAIEKGTEFIKQLVPGASSTTAATSSGLVASAPPNQPAPQPSFNVRQIRQDGIACTSQTAVARVASCVMGRGQPDCKAQVDDTLAKGECTRLPAGTKATIEAGSHSFDWVRFRVNGKPQPMWAERSMVLD